MRRESLRIKVLSVNRYTVDTCTEDCFGFLRCIRFSIQDVEGVESVISIVSEITEKMNLKQG